MASVEAIKAHLKHPIIDCDGHWLEWHPILVDYIGEVAGPKLRDAYLASQSRRSDRRDFDWYEATPQQRWSLRMRKQVGWRVPVGQTRDYATTKLPSLMKERLDEFGIDFSIVYPTTGLGFDGIRDDELRQAVYRAFNTMTADVFRAYRDRFSPVAVVPRRTPEEAVAEIDYAVNHLGLKAIVLNGALLRSAPESRERYVDALGLDNEFDYDPLWKACVEHGVAVTAHGGALSWPDHAAVSNFVYNHIGHFAEANHAFAKAVFLGGVARRFPTLNFGFLEGGVGWACNLYLDLVGHWEKRNVDSLDRYLRPDRLDETEFERLVQQYGSDRMKSLGSSEVLENMRTGKAQSLREFTDRQLPYLDDFAAAGVGSKREIAELFSRNFYFGCEADDKTVMWACDARIGTRLKPVFSSDLSHWDALVMDDVVPESYELLEKGFISEQDFREFTFSNAVRLHGRMNPAFFEGTAIEAEAKAELGSTAQASVPVSA